MKAPARLSDTPLAELPTENHAQPMVDRWPIGAVNKTSLGAAKGHGGMLDDSLSLCDEPHLRPPEWKAFVSSEMRKRMLAIERGEAAEAIAGTRCGRARYWERGSVVGPYSSFVARSGDVGSSHRASIASSLRTTEVSSIVTVSGPKAWTLPASTRSDFLPPKSPPRWNGRPTISLRRGSQ